MPKNWILGKYRGNSTKPGFLKRSLFRIRYLLIIPIGIYQKAVSPLMPPSCRFYPSCSTYARQAIEKYGLFKGLRLAIFRFSKCHPYHPGGYDPLK
ncbi:MAG: membrane protein insertion efficiency factor YidD [Desulfatiglandaceae bacterium]